MSIRRRLGLGLAGLLLATLIACPLAVSLATASPGTATRWWHSPIVVSRHMLSVGIIPCGPAAPGKLIVAYNAFISSRYPPPGLYISTSPPCP
jgi:hypothetical protein